MCGIFGIYLTNTILNYKKTVELILNGLRMLEYRGYDSAGFAFGTPTTIIKTKGNINELERMSLENLDNYSEEEYNKKLSEPHHVSISHTRWATHGIPSTINAHPHSSDSENNFAVVHNGIINNYKKIKIMLEEMKYSFKSDSDTEVLPILCKMYYDNGQKDFLKIVRNMLNMIEGTYAVLIKSNYFPNEVIACKNKSPLIIGKKNNGYIFSSDVNSIVEHTDMIYYLNDDDIIYIKDGIIKMYNSQKIVDINFEQTKIELNSILKGKYSHYMEKEIFEQPISITNTFKDRIDNGTVKFNMLNASLYTKIFSTNKIVFIACGTSLNACISSYSNMEKLTRVPTYYENACNFLDRNAIINTNDLYIFVSQSGETSDVLETLRYIKPFGAYCIGITNVYGSTLSREVNHCVYLNAGNEIGVGSTKAYTSQIVLINILSFCFYQHLKKFNMIQKVPNTNELENDKNILNLLSSFETLPAMIFNLLEIYGSSYKKLAQMLKHEKHILFIGRESNYATALECALKFKEIPYIHSEAILAGELKHGPLALIDDSILCIIFATEDELYSKNLATVNQLKSRNARIIVVCNDITDFANMRTLLVFKTHKYLQPIINVIPFQLLAYYIAVENGYNVDQPRNLAKSVTVSD